MLCPRHSFMLVFVCILQLAVLVPVYAQPAPSARLARLASQAEGAEGLPRRTGRELNLESKAKGLAHYIMAVCHDLNGEASAAIDEYQQSVKFNGNEAAPRLRLGAYYARLNQIDDAIAQLKAVNRIAPQETHAHYLLALIYSSQKHFTLAAAEYEAILKYASRDNPENIEIYMYLAQLYYAQHKYPDAIDQFKQILQLQPHHVSANYLLGSVYADIRERAPAMEAFRRVLEVEPSHDGALNSLGYLYAEEGVNLDEALDMIRKAIALNPSNGAYYDSLGWVLYKKGMYAQALMAFQKAENYIQDPIIYEHMGDVYKAVEEFALARKFWRKSLEMDSNQPPVRQKIQELEKTQAYKDEPASAGSHRSP